MCGINGFNFSDPKQAELMNEAIKHRGPDDEGVFTDQDVSLGHVRLSTVDLSTAGRQPMTYEHAGKTATVVLDGEMYNFMDIREKLEGKGHRFRSATYDEVAVASYLEWGFECIKLFNGAWALAIYDPAKKILFCSRDILGVRPFYYYLDGNRFIFSSELKGILSHRYLSLNERRNINRQAVDLYFTLGFIPSPYTIYNGVFKLEPRRNLIFNLVDERIEKWFYYTIPKYRPVNDYEKLVEEGKSILKDAVRLRMIADVPVGALLSGGLDSSTIVSFMSQLIDVKNMHTFSIGFEGDYDETPFANIIKDYFETNHHHHHFAQRDFEDLIETYSFIYDEPFSDYSGFPTYMICKKARDHITVALTGEGGDEIFGGYPEYVAGCRIDFIRKIPRLLRIILSRIPAKRNLSSYESLFLLKKAFYVSLYDPQFFYEKALEGEVVLPEVCRAWMREKLQFCVPYGGGSMAETLRLYDLLFHTGGDNWLVKTDRASMSNGLEVRSPFLDHRFIEFSQKVPTRWKVDLFHTKKLMREMIEDLLPPQIVQRKKQGFVPPMQEWILDKKYESFIAHSLEMLKDLSPEHYHFFRERVLKSDGRLYGLYKIRLFLFGKWMDRWIKRTTSAPSEISDDAGMAI